MGSYQNTNTQTAKLFPTKSHSHSLEFKHYLKPYTRDGCKELGFGPRYRCEKCNFDLHKHCMFPQLFPTFHEFFPKSTFKFFTTPPNVCCKRLCDACLKPINGFVYHCEEQDLDLHQCCRNLKRKYQIVDEEEELEFKLHKKVKGKCLWCYETSIKEGNHNNGWSYISKRSEYHIHVGCVTQMIMERWKALKEDSVNNETKLSVHKSSTDQSLALEIVNLKEIQARAKGYGKSGNKFWRTLKVFLEIIVSIVLGDPTMAFVDLFSELFG